MTLTENDYYSISEQITEGNGSVEYSKDGETLLLDYSLQIDGYTKAEALKTAWLNFRLKEALKVTAVVFTYRKKDGTTRKAFGTLLYPHSEKPQSESKASDKVQIYFDIEKQAWRSFNKWNLVSIE